MIAFVNLVNNENLDEAVAYLQKALSILPGSENVAYILGQVYMRQQNYAQARGVFENLAATEFRAPAQQFLNIIKQIEDQKLAIKEYENRPPSEETTLPANIEEAKNQAINEALFELKPGEKRSVGYLTKVTCPKEVVFSIRTDDKVLNLTKADFQSIEMRSYSEQANDFSIGCNLVKEEFYVVVVYKPTANPKAKTDGEVVSLEFMPPEFRLLQ